MEKIKDMTNKQLKEEYKSLYESVYIIECYSVKDMIYLDLLENELEKRGISIHIKEQVIFEN